MIASPSVSSSSSSSAPSHLLWDRPFRRCSSLPPLRTARSAQIPRFSASCAPAPERERERADGHGYYYHHYSRSYSCGGGGRGSMAAPAGTLYDVLGLTAGATAHQIKAAYRRLARACHPDVAATDRKGASADEFMRVHAAYATLSDPDKRTEYDRRIMAPPSATRRRTTFSWASTASASRYSPPSPASPNSSSPSSSFGRRTWETDQCW